MATNIFSYKPYIYAVKYLVLTIFILPLCCMANEYVYDESVISSGSRTYARFCSICHGDDAKGNGKFTSNINTVPPNLTEISKNNNGIFPWIDLYNTINGVDTKPSHGKKDMPIWGELFNINSWSEHHIEHSDTIVRGRIFELLMYLRSLQE